MEDKMKDMNKLITDHEMEIQTMRGTRNMDKLEIQQLKEREEELHKVVELKDMEITQLMMELAEMKRKVEEIDTKTEIKEAANELYSS